jgi:hypothetical protein
MVLFVHGLALDKIFNSGSAHEDVNCVRAAPSTA